MLHALVLLTVLALAPGGAAAIQVCATTTDLGSLVHEVGGDDVELTVFAKGTEDAHFVEPRPSFVRKLSGADLLVLNGMDLEIGWLPALVQNARNGRVLPAGPGYLDASRAIEALEVPGDAVDRSRGDVHAYGNPHYLLDPLNGLAVARLIRDRLRVLDPPNADGYDARLASFERRLRAALVGAPLAVNHDVVELARLAARAELRDFLVAEGHLDELAGWLGRTLPGFGVRAVADHNLWVYFARRFGVRMIGYLEPKPGVPPTTRHLQQLIEQMRAEGVKLIFSAAYYDPRHTRFVAEATGARVVEVAHQVGARPGTDDYLAMIGYNVRQLERGRAGD